ncbi:sce7726 family protein [Hoeflea sp. G2-23]|uniref:Sce7726 family protein n=1 Tax=Hoeflea algicola TaxID=2983763 RepID=A0ABT3ZCQ2_9HYPH|nr:sce7726 family protein [Hoeflea algicola]MCY0149519.1 sce7726 family protein [Hoeflea algicola]
MKDHLDLEERRYATEVEIRTALVHHLAREARSKNCILATEAVYGFENRRADVLELDDQSHAFEIKSDYDNTSRLPGQLAEYLKTFDFVTVVTTPKHLPNVRGIAPKRVGLVVFDGYFVEPIRKPVINKQLSKFHLASGTTKSRLLKALPSSLRSRGVYEVRAAAVKLLTTKVLRSLFLSELAERFSESSAAFFSETDAQIAAEDLLLLQRSSRLFV